MKHEEDACNSFNLRSTCGASLQEVALVVVTSQVPISSYTIGDSRHRNKLDMVILLVHVHRLSIFSLTCIEIHVRVETK